MTEKKVSKKTFTKLLSQYSFVLVFIAIFIVYAVASSGLTWNGVMNIFRHSAVIGIIGTGMGLVCLTGEIDLSVGSMLSLESYQTLYSFGNGKAATLPIVGIVLLLVVFLFTYLSTSTKFGKKIYAIGSNSKGAAMAGINVKLMKVIVFVIDGVLVGVGAFLWIAMNASSDPATTGKSYEMYAIASAVLGGISMSGGRGKCLGILFGAMSYTVIDKIIVALKMDSLINDAIKGIILLLVILIQMAGPKLKGERT